jgi:hypothetical protein
MMLHVATLDVISVAAAVDTHTTTTMAHDGSTLKKFGAVFELHV